MDEKKTFKLDILASDKPFYSGMCEMLVFPALDGEQGVLPHHEPTVTCTREGELRYKVDGEWRYAAVSKGIVEIMPSYVILLADTVEDPEEIDIRRAEEARERAREQLRQKQSIREYYQTQAALNRALSRLKVSNRKMKY
ncbi:MAG TPA: ATP synthase F1 subunit epsilon [Candidatus Monoglobus merdigallinarum]|uniref:ATP synthase epsilon chain n=1 Tax=Candidatus Monoglobus merdigallinarum TaxID=2838698 RepID=A0A9D1PR32_9FIRM|nr:ATP synthase F1 subunit epsilon [Candidatus Monoglobus merdigallinarum]